MKRCSMGYMKFPTLGNRKVPKLARLQRIFPASIQLTTSSFGVKDRGQSRLYGGPQLSRQSQKPHGKTENLTAKPKTSRQKQNTSWQNRKPHGKNKIPHDKAKNLTVKPKTSRQKQNTSRQNRKPHGKNKIPHNKTKNLTAKPNTSHGNTSLYFISVYDVTIL